MGFVGDLRSDLRSSSNGLARRVRREFSCGRQDDAVGLLVATRSEAWNEATPRLILVRIWFVYT